MTGVPGEEIASSPQREALVASLADLDAELEAGNLSAEDHARLSAAYRARLDELEEGGGKEEPLPSKEAPSSRSPSIEARSPSPRSGQARRRKRVLLLVGSGCLAVAGLLLAFELVFNSSSTRLPGESASGAIKLSSPDQLRQSLKQAQVLEEEGNYRAALEVYQAVLAKYPDQPEALAYSGWILRLAGLATRSKGAVRLESSALGDEEKAVAAAPGYADARYFLGAIELEDLHDPSSAVEQFGAFLADSPSPGFLAAARPVVEEAYREAGMAVPSALGG